MPVLSSVVITVAFCVVILLLGCYFATRRLSWLVRHRALLFGIVAVSGIVVYSIGYLASVDSGKNVGDCISAGLMAVFSTGRMFVLENDFGEFYQEVLTQAYRIAFGGVMTIGMLAIVMVALSLFGFSFLSSLRIKMLRIFGVRRPVYIFSCLNKQALALERDIKKEDPRALVLFIVPHRKEDMEADDQKLFKSAAPDNTFILVSEQYGRSLNEFGIFRALKKTRIHFVANNSDLSLNAQTFLKLSELLKPSEMKESVTLHVLTDKSLYGHIFDSSGLSGINFVVLDRNALVSQDFMNHTAVIRYARARFHDGRADGQLTVMVVGESPVIPYLMKDIITQGQFLGLQLKLIVAGDNASDTTAQFLADNPEAARFASLEHADISPASAPFYAYYSNTLKEIDLVICAGPDDEANARLVNTMKHMAAAVCATTQFCALIRSSGLSKIYQTSRDILAFGEDAIFERASIVINEKLDNMSKAVHQYYCQIYGGGLPWQQLANYDRESSRALALHINSKLYALGMETVRTEDALDNTDVFETLVSSVPEVLENLAVGEHMRWGAHLATHGWTQLPIADKFLKADHVSKRHPCLVCWDDLNTISAAAGQDYKEIDRQLIANLPAIAANGHMKIIQRRF